MINMIALECNWNWDWPSKKFPTVWNKIKKWFGPDLDIAVMYIDKDHHKIKLNRWKDPKNVLNDITVTEVQ